MLLLRSQSGRFRGQDFVIWPNTFYRRSVCHAKALKFQSSVDSSCCSDLSSSVSSQPLRRHHSSLFQASVSKTKGDSKQLVGSRGVKKKERFGSVGVTTQPRLPSFSLWHHYHAVYCFATFYELNPWTGYDHLDNSFSSEIVTMISSTVTVTNKL